MNAVTKLYSVARVVACNLLACSMLAAFPILSKAGSLLNHISAVDTYGYVAWATLSIYEAGTNDLISSQEVRSESLFQTWENTGTAIVFSNPLAFPSPYPRAGDNGNSYATITSLAVDLNTAIYDNYLDLVTVEMDWGGTAYSFTHEWGMIHGDDFVNWIAYYLYSDSYYPGPKGELLSNGYYAELAMTFASGLPPVPVPASVWLLGSGVLWMAGVARRKKNS